MYRWTSLRFPCGVRLVNCIRNMAVATEYNRSDQELINQLKRKHVQGDVLFDNWVKKGHQPTGHILSLVINNLVKRRRLEQAKEYLTRREMYNIQPTAKIYNPILTSLQNPLEIKEYFTKMAQEGSIPDEVSYSILIQKYHAAGDNQSAYNTMHELIAEGFTPTIFTVFPLIKGFAQEENYKILDEVLDIIKKYNVEIDVKLLDTLIERIPSPVISWRYYKTILEENGIYSSFLILNRLVSRLAKQNDTQSWKTMKDVIITLRGYGQKPSESVLKEIQNYCKDEEMIQFLQQQIDSPPLFLPNENKQLRDLVKQNRMEKCIARYKELRKNNMIPTHYTFSILMQCYVKKGDTNSVLNLHNEMKKFEMQPNSTMVNIALNYLCRKKPVSVVEQFLQSVGHSQVKSSSYCLDSFVALWLREKSFWETIKTIEAQKNVVLSCATYSRMICHVIHSKGEHKERQNQMKHLLEMIMANNIKLDGIISSDMLHGIYVFKLHKLIDAVRYHLIDKEITMTPGMLLTICRIEIANDDPTTALSYFYKILRSGKRIPGDIIQEIIPLLLKHNQREQIETLFEKMKEIDLTEDYKCIKGTVTQLSNEKEFELAGMLLCNVGHNFAMHIDALLVALTFEMIQNKKIIPAITMLTNVINSSLGSPEIFQMLSHLRNLVPEGQQE